MKITKLMSLLATVLITAFIFTSCTEEDNPVDPNTDVPNAPANISAVSKNSNTVEIKWTASTSESDAQFDGYTLSVTPGVMQYSIPAGQTTYTVSALDEGTVYTFSLTAEFSNGNSSNPAEIDWSPAGRYTETFGDPIRIYGAESSVGSGLQLYDNVEEGPMVRTVSGSNNWNFAFDDRDGHLYFGTAGEGVIEYNWKNGAPANAGEIGSVVFNAATLDEAYESYSLTDGITYGYDYVDLNNYTDDAAVIVYGRVMNSGSNDYNYARILIKKGANGYLQNDALGDYIEVEISYQKVAGVPYAGIKQ